MNLEFLKQPGVKYAVIAGALVLAVVSAFSLRVLTQFGHFTTLKPRFDGSCQAIVGVPGPEDLQIDRARGVAYISSDDRRNPDKGGALYRLDLKAPAPEPKEIFSRSGFHPHGLSFYESPSLRRLMVIDHAADGGRVLIFDMDGEGGLALADEITDLGEAVSPNDLVAVGPRRFYLTHDLSAAQDTMSYAWQVATRARTGALIYFDGAQAREMVSDLRFANGVNVSADGSAVYVAETSGQSLSIYNRTPATGDLELRDRVYVGTALDNIDVDADGALWIAAHPKLLTFAGHAKNAKKRAPSQVIWARADEGGGEIDQIYLDEGAAFSGASVAARYENRMLMGSVFEDKLWLCELPEEPRHSRVYPASRPQ